MNSNYEILINRNNKIDKDFYKNFELIEVSNVEDETQITLYNYEPWHIRYIGKEIANECFEKNIVLEEYYNLNL